MFSLEQSFSTAQFELTAVLFNLTAITSRTSFMSIQFNCAQLLAETMSGSVLAFTTNNTALSQCSTPCGDDERISIAEFAGVRLRRVGAQLLAETMSGSVIAPVSFGFPVQ